MSETLIKVEGVSKKFCRSLKKSLWYGMQDLGREITGRKHGGDGELRPDEFWAVKDVSFELKRGECLGLIGRNGAGKTTLLKMLNGLIKPDSGRIEMRGRVGVLIALGAGFNPILTGRENIYINGSVLGFTKKQLDSKVEEIIDFAEIGEFIDSPVQSYSSGMNVRLGFAIASSLDPDILILDEVLAVGDSGFRSKCYNRIDKISKKSAIIFVSHSMPHIARMCGKTIFLERGFAQGPHSTNIGIERYERSFASENQNLKRIGGGQILFSSICLNGKSIDITQSNKVSLAYGQRFEMEANLLANQECNIVVDITFHSSSGDAVAECNNYIISDRLKVEVGNRNKLKLKIDKITLNPGTYHVAFLIMSENMLSHYDWLIGCCELSVLGRPAIAGQQFIGEWNIS